MSELKLAEIGEALYGSTWQTEMARKLGVGSRDIRYWNTGGRKTPAWVWEDLARICAERAKVLAETVTKLSREHEIQAAYELAIKPPSQDTDAPIKTVHHNINHA